MLEANKFEVPESLLLNGWLLFVTLNTLDLSVLAAQVVAGHTVIEVLNFPRDFVVTGETFSVLELLREIFAVLIFMARQAVLLESCEFEVTHRLLRNRGCLLVTLKTLYFHVFSAKWVASDLVLKLRDLPLFLIRVVARETLAVLELRRDVSSVLILVT